MNCILLIKHMGPTTFQHTMNQKIDYIGGTYSYLEQCLGLEILDAEQGFIRCPGEHLHSTQNHISDCKVWFNPGGVRVHCFHQSCTDLVNHLNIQLARRSHWNRACHASRNALASRDAERAAVKKLQQEARDGKLDILRDCHWSYAAIAADSPEPIELEPRNHWYYVLNLFDNDDIVWVGRDIHDTGKSNHRWRFRPAIGWMGGTMCPGQFVCPNTFKKGVHSRADANILARKFLVVESDTLSRDQVGAIFRWLEKYKSMQLRAVVDTAGKSLHGWFDYPPPELVKELKIVLPELECDKALFGASQPCRLPGAIRDGKYQKLIYIK